MAILQKESGIAYGRGFSGTDVNGLMAKFYTWVTKAAGAGGPGWFIISDHSADGTDPYIVVSDYATPGYNDYNTGKTGRAPKIAKIGFVSTDSGKCFLEGYLGFSGTDPVGLFCRVEFENYDAGNFNYQFKGGDKFIAITTYDGDTMNGFAMFVDWTADLNVCESSSVIAVLPSGFSGVSTTTATVAMTTGDENLFTVGNKYFITDSRSTAMVDAVECTAIDTVGHTVTIERKSDSDNNWSDTDYQTGALLGSYPHRFCILGRENSGQNEENYANMPYVSYYGTGINHKYFNSVNYNNPWCANARNTWLGKDADVAQKMYLGREARAADGEGGASGENRLYGVVDDCYIANTYGMVRMTNGKTIDSAKYLYHAYNDDNYAILVLDDASAV